MKFCAGCLLKEDRPFLLGDQSDGHDQSLTGLQETRTELGLSSSFNYCRSGYHVLPAATGTYTHTEDT